MGNKWGTLTRDERLKIEILDGENYKPIEIAKKLKRNRSTISRELKKGKCELITSQLEKVVCYDADYSDRQATKRRKKCGAKQKELSKEYIEYIEYKIKIEKYLPEALLLFIYKNRYDESVKIKLDFTCSVSFKTIYNYIHKKRVFNLTMDDLPYHYHKRYSNEKPLQKRASAGVSIDKRPFKNEDRTEFGHFEMDSVMGNRGETKKCLLAITERKTRFEIISLMNQHNTENVKHCINHIEERMGYENFRKIFKDITVDNGTEFSDTKSIKQSSIHKDKDRVNEIYYCHPHSPSERSVNERNNRVIRNRLDKDMDFDTLTDNQVQDLQYRVNTYPRKLYKKRYGLPFDNAKEYFVSELKKLEKVFFFCNY